MTGLRIGVRASADKVRYATVIDLKRVRENPEAVRESQRARGEDPALVDELLAAEDLAAADVRGYHDVEPSHAAVAQAVAAGGADAGLGIEAAARARGLDFVPLIAEDYHLVCLKEALDEAPVAALRATAPMVIRPSRRRWGHSARMSRHRATTSAPGAQPDLAASPEVLTCTWTLSLSGRGGGG